MKYTDKQLQKILADHNLFLFGAGGKRADLSHTDLRYAKLSYANLIGADLRHADLYNADLRYAKLSNANLRDADLTNADLTNANLSGAALSNVTLSNTLILGESVNRAPVQLHPYPYSVLITDTMMQIGCQIHSIDEWLAFTVEEIYEMDSDAKKFYENYRKLIQAAVISHRIPKEENKES